MNCTERFDSRTMSDRCFVRIFIVTGCDGPKEACPHLPKEGSSFEGFGRTWIAGKPQLLMEQGTAGVVEVVYQPPAGAAQ